ncbi:MAG: UvrD-helicase domain-containing protein [Holosporales bacterium]|nr:UvrD-helicase domain-containing protein [Holosporales bacterium]
MKYKSEFYEATEIDSSCFVFASAGTGKTTILVNRYIKSLFFGMKPQEILCITFTNAAVFEIESRISETLEKLYINENNYAKTYLEKTLNLKAVSQSDMEKAERLFFEFQDNFSKSKITTIHAFCHSLIQQFPLESGISPNFELLEENEAIKLVGTAKETVLSKISEETLKSLSKLFTIHSLEELVEKIYQIFSKFTKLFNAYESVDSYRTFLNKKFNLDKVKSFSLEQKNFINKVLKLENLEEAYLTKIGTLRKKIPFANNDISAQIAEIVYQNSQNEKKKKVIDKTCSFLELVREIANEYQSLKIQENVLDFSDVLQKAKYLLTESCAKEFIISRICSKLKVMMVDEAQDLSSIQWELLSLFSVKIFSDLSNDKTIFIVGDAKQSIYRFQNANCKLFSKFYLYCREKLQSLDKKFKVVYLDTCYRTLPKILESIDEVFRGKIANFALDGGAISYKNHHPARNVPRGTFSLIGINYNEESTVKQIAEQIKTFHTTDTLILTRSRNELSEKLTKELLISGVKLVSPARIKLFDSILAKDLIAIAKVCIDSNEDYALSCVLKSPYFFDNPLTNENLFTICHNRIVSVFNNLKVYFPRQYESIKVIIDHYEENSLRRFFYYLTTLLNKTSKEDDEIISKFMNEVSKFSEKKSDNIPEFLDHILKNDAQITFQTASKDCVRLLTIHGAKGLEADTVFVLDFALDADKSKTKFIFSDNSDFEKENVRDDILFFIKPTQSDSFEEIDKIIEDEYLEEQRELHRLLYVAMTRAKDNLYMFGQDTGKNAYSLVNSILKPTSQKL